MFEIIRIMPIVLIYIVDFFFFQGIGFWLLEAG